MKFDPVTFTLHDGRECTLRSAEPEDAAALADYLNQVFGESPYLSRGAGEWTQTVEKETAWIEGKLADPRSVPLLALVDGVIAAVCDLHPAGQPLRLAHRAGIGVSVRRDYWRQGIANRMLQTLLDCARAYGYEQVDLEVVADNFRAVPLYMKHGFQVYGTRPHGLRYPDGSYASEYLMYKKL